MIKRVRVPLQLPQTNRQVSMSKPMSAWPLNLHAYQCQCGITNKVSNPHCLEPKTITLAERPSPVKASLDCRRFVTVQYQARTKLHRQQPLHWHPPTRLGGYHASPEMASTSVATLPVLVASGTYLYPLFPPGLPSFSHESLPLSMKLVFKLLSIFTYNTQRDSVSRLSYQTWALINIQQQGGDDIQITPTYDEQYDEWYYYGPATSRDLRPIWYLAASK